MTKSECRVQKFENGNLYRQDLLHGRGCTHRFVTNVAPGDMKSATASVNGLTDLIAISAFPAFWAAVEELCRRGEPTNTVEARQFMQDAIVVFAGVGERGQIRISTGPRKAPVAEPQTVGTIDSPAEFISARAVGEAAHKVIQDALDRDLTDTVLMDAVDGIFSDPSLDAETKIMAVEALQSRRGSHVLERTPESIAAFALASAMDKRTKGTK